MIIGVPREIHRHEHRVGLTPFAVARLIEDGHTVFVEKEAGLEARFKDRDYEEAGARIVYSAEEAHQRADIVCRVGQLAPDELELMKPGEVVVAFHHLAVSPRPMVERLAELEATLIGYEVIRDEDGSLPVLVPFSEMAGQMAVNIAAHYLQTEVGGRGILLGNVPGVAPPTVLILGAGTVGRTAARQALANGAHVIVVDADVTKLRALNQEAGGRVTTVTSNLDRLEKFTAIADVVIGAVLIPGEKAPFLVTSEMVKAMKPGSVVIDVSIDQGGCIETSRPTTLDSPTFVLDDVIHYCVPNFTANIARTASRALSTVALPYLLQLLERGVEQALLSDPGLAEGVHMFQGRLVKEVVAETLGLEATRLADLLGKGTSR